MTKKPFQRKKLKKLLSQQGIIFEKNGSDEELLNLLIHKDKQII